MKAAKLVEEKERTTQITHEIKDDFFSPIENSTPYLKAAFEGFAGSGKTFTASCVAIGLYQRINSTKPIIIFDTEKSSKFLKPLFAENNIQVLVRESRSLMDLKETMRRCREGLSDILVIDSITHVWENFMEAYKEKVGRKGLQFQDWGIIKPAWKKEFSEMFVSDPYHIFMTGRAGYEYENEMNPETMKREIFKSGIKMKVEGETAYEPDILVLMERYEEVLGKNKSIWREATIIKDRSQLIDGKTFKNPLYDNFSPAVEYLLSDVSPNRKSIIEGDSGLLIETEQSQVAWRKEKEKVLEEIQGVMVAIAPGQSTKEKQWKVNTLHEVFGTRSWIAVQELHLDKLKAGLARFEEIKSELELALQKGEENENAN